MDFKTKPYAHQLEAFEKFKDSEYFALFMDMGTGKTKVLIDIAAYKFEKGEIDAVLIIAPNHVHSQWLNEEFPKHCSIEYVPWLWHSGDIKKRWYNARLEEFLSMKSNKLKVLAINVEAFQSDTVIPYAATFVKRNKVFSIVDEASRIKTPTAKRTKAIAKLNKYGVRALATGTPATKSPFDLWSQFEFLNKDYFRCNFFTFQHRYGIMMRASNMKTGQSYNALIDEKTFSIAKHKINTLKKQKVDRGEPEELTNRDFELLSALLEMSESNVRYIDVTPQYVKFKRLDELRDIISQDVYTAKKSECLDLPEKIYEHMLVEMSPAQKRVYKNIKNELRAEWQGKELTVFNKLVVTARLQQISGGFFPYNDEEEGTTKVIPIEKTNVKIIRLLEDLEEVNFETTKVIIWAAFVAELKLIYAELSKTYNCCLYYGGVLSYKREQIKKDFVQGKYDIFIGNTATAGFGLNLQNATLQYYYSNTFNVENRLQAEDRSHRIGVKNVCVYKDVVLKGTIDEKIHKAIKSGRDMNDYFKTQSLKDLLSDEEE